MSIVKRAIVKAIPPQTRMGRKLKKMAAKVGLAKPLHFNGEYKHWIDYSEGASFVPVLKEGAEGAPLFSIVTPFFNTPPKYLHPLINSIVNQSFQNWELIMVDASTQEKSKKLLRKVSEEDRRLKYTRIPNQGISANTNEALKHAKGEYIVFVDHDDTLSRHALNEMAARIRQDPTIDILYSDEDKLSDDGKWRHSPLFKPDWSPHLFMYTNYTNHLSVIKRKLIEEVGGLRPEFDGSQDYDLLLRIHAKQKGPRKVVHIPKILYHWREAAGSTAVDYKRKSYAFEAGRKALEEYIQMRGMDGVIEVIPETPGFFRAVLRPSRLRRAHVFVRVSPDVVENASVVERLKTHTRSGIEVHFHSYDK